MTTKRSKTVAAVAAAQAADSSTNLSPVTLSIDVGGSGLKAMLLDPAGKPLGERKRVATPAVSTPEAVLAGLEDLHAQLPGFDRVSVGFPGVIKRGVTMGAVNLHPGWASFPLQQELERRWKKPVRVGNDADVQGYGAIQGEGLEMVLTLGTGMGAALFIDGHLCPGLELGHHPFRKSKTYEDCLGRRGLDKYGKEKWNEMLQEAIALTAKIFSWDHLYLGGGNTKKINFELGTNVTIVPNETGLLGGVVLWKDQA